jgi:hypothetical protein
VIIGATASMRADSEVSVSILPSPVSEPSAAPLLAIISPPRSLVFSSHGLSSRSSMVSAASAPAGAAEFMLAHRLGGASSVGSPAMPAIVETPRLGRATGVFMTDQALDAAALASMPAPWTQRRPTPHCTASEPNYAPDVAQAPPAKAASDTDPDASLASSSSLGKPETPLARAPRPPTLSVASSTGPTVEVGVDAAQTRLALGPLGQLSTQPMPTPRGASEGSPAGDQDSLSSRQGSVQSSAPSCGSLQTSLVETPPHAVTEFTSPPSLAQLQPRSPSAAPLPAPSPLAVPRDRSKGNIKPVVTDAVPAAPMPAPTPAATPAATPAVPPVPLSSAAQLGSSASKRSPHLATPMDLEEGLAELPVSRLVSDPSSSDAAPSRSPHADALSTPSFSTGPTRAGSVVAPEQPSLPAVPEDHDTVQSEMSYHVSTLSPRMQGSSPGSRQPLPPMPPSEGRSPLEKGVSAPQTVPKRVSRAQAAAVQQQTVPASAPAHHLEPPTPLPGDSPAAAPLSVPREAPEREFNSPFSPSLGLSVTLDTSPAEEPQRFFPNPSPIAEVEDIPEVSLLMKTPPPVPPRPHPRLSISVGTPVDAAIGRIRVYPDPDARARPPMISVNSADSGSSQGRRPPSLMIPDTQGLIMPHMLPRLSPNALRRLTQTRTANNTYTPPTAVASPERAAVKGLEWYRFGATLPCRITADGRIVPTAQLADDRGTLLTSPRPPAAGGDDAHALSGDAPGDTIPGLSFAAEGSSSSSDAAGAAPPQPSQAGQPRSSSRRPSFVPWVSFDTPGSGMLSDGLGSLANPDSRPSAGSSGMRLSQIGPKVRTYQLQLFCSNLVNLTSSLPQGYGWSMQMDPSDQQRMLRRQRKPTASEMYWARYVTPGHSLSYALT